MSEKMISKKFLISNFKGKKLITTYTFFLSWILLMKSYTG